MTDAGPIQHSGWLTGGDFGDSEEPMRLFSAWLDEAKASEISDPNAMALATVDSSGLPNIRMVLMKGFDARGFVFYTNKNSQKGQELDAHPQAALSFHWKSLRRQVRIRGPVTQVSDAESDAYFATRPRMAQIGAWASQQSAPLESRFALEKAVALYTAKHPTGAVPRPPYWIGYNVAPMVMEFWREMPFRLHERIEFRRSGADAPWSKTRLYP
jgi:pyridoxamine 5'-phosphate oxidase